MNKMLDFKAKHNTSSYLLTNLPYFPDNSNATIFHSFATDDKSNS